MPLLRRRFVCFYCGCRSAKSRAVDTRQWQCERCEAVNHLDEKGEITDPPASASQSGARFAHSVPRSTSPELASAEESLFCARCLTNQHLLTQTLASYLPAPTHPDYAQFEKSYPKYRKELEERYPPVCRTCEPRVRERLQVTGYAAKTDHLRRMVEQTRNGQAKRLRPWGWQDNVVALAAVCWWMSLLVQFAWHSLSVIKWTDEPIGLRQQDSRADSQAVLSECMRRSLRTGPLDSACDKTYRTFVGQALLLGLLSAWWNPRLRQKLRGNVGRMVGLVEYYKLQVVFLPLRAAAWGLLAQLSAFGSGTKHARATHSFMAAFIAISIILSYRTVQWDPTPRISFRSNIEPLLPPDTSEQRADYPNETTPMAAQAHRNINSSITKPPPERFSINSLAPQPQRPYPTPYNPPTPPPDSDDDTDTMDWTPSQTALPPASSYRSSKQPPLPLSTTNPFHGTLPPRPISQAHALRNPIYQPPTPLSRATAQQENFFRRNPPHTPNPKPSPKTDTRNLTTLSQAQLDPDSVITTPLSPTASDAPSISIDAFSSFSPRVATFAPPRFFPRQDFENDTGLENLFSSVFSLGDGPSATTIPHVQQPDEATREPERCASSWLLRGEVLGPVVILAVVLQVWVLDLVRYWL